MDPSDDPYSSSWARIAPALLFAAATLVLAALASEARRLPAAPEAEVRGTGESAATGVFAW